MNQYAPCAKKELGISFLSRIDHDVVDLLHPERQSAPVCAAVPRLGFVRRPFQQLLPFNELRLDLLEIFPPRWWIEVGVRVFEVQLQERLAVLVDKIDVGKVVLVVRRSARTWSGLVFLVLAFSLLDQREVDVALPDIVRDIGELHKMCDLVSFAEDLGVIAQRVIGLDGKEIDVLADELAELPRLQQIDRGREGASDRVMPDPPPNVFLVKIDVADVVEIEDV